MNRAIQSIVMILLLGSPVVEGQILGGLGIKGGITLANQSYRFTPIGYTMETQSIAGPAGALFVEAFGGKHLSCQFDLGYEYKGSKTNTESVTVNHFENDRIVVNKGNQTVSEFSYLVFSPMARYRLDLANLTPYLLLGPRLDFLLKYKTSSDYPLETQNSLILGLTCGAGVEYSFRFLGLFLELQYQPDLSPVTNKDPLLINNTAFLFNLGFRIKKGSL